MIRRQCAQWVGGIIVAALFLIGSAPAWSQQNHSETKDRNSVANIADAANKNALGESEGVTKLPAMRGPLFAPPEPPKPNPFPAASLPDAIPPGRLFPRYEVAGMYSYIDFHPGTPFANFNSHGGSGSFTYNATSWLGLTGELAGYQFNRNLFPLTGNNQSVSGGITTYMFGPRLNWRRFDWFVPFEEFLIGGAHAGTEMTGGNGQTSLAMATGGGVDMVITKNFAWRFAQLDYLVTRFSGLALGTSSHQNNFRAATGIVLRFGFPSPPPPVNHPPVVSCSVNPTSLYAGSDTLITIRVDASDPDNDPLNYNYMATGGKIEGTGSDTRWNSAGVTPGTYTVTVKADDGKGGTGTCSADIKVEEKPNRPPTVSLSVEPASILPGERANVAAAANDPDGDPLNYNYSASAGQIVGSGPRVQFDSTGLQPGQYTVKVTVNDGRGGTADASGNVEVREHPQVKQLEAKLSLHSIYFPTAQPTEQKPNEGLTASQEGTLDTLASDFQQYLKYRPDAHLILEGHADIRGGKEYNEKLSERRVERTRSYLVEKGVPADHLETKAFGFEKNMTSEEVQKLIEADPDLSAEDKQKILKNLLTVRMANNRRVDVTLSTTGEQSVRRFPFNSKDALTLLGNENGTGKTRKRTTAPKKNVKP